MACRQSSGIADVSSQALGIEISGGNDGHRHSAAALWMIDYLRATLQTLEDRKHALPLAGQWKQIQGERLRRQQPLRAAMRQPAATELQWKPADPERRARQNPAVWPDPAS